MLNPASTRTPTTSPYLTPALPGGHKSCPYCHSEQVQRTEVIYETGAPAPSRIQVVSPFYARVIKDALADKATPPGTVCVKDVWECYLGRVASDWAIALFAGALLFCMHWYWLLPLVPVLPAWFSLKYFREGRQAILEARAQNAAFMDQFSEWKKTYMCMECGGKFIPEAFTANDASFDNVLEQA